MGYTKIIQLFHNNIIRIDLFTLKDKTCITFILLPSVSKFERLPSPHKKTLNLSLAKRIEM